MAVKGRVAGHASRGPGGFGPGSVDGRLPKCDGAAGNGKVSGVPNMAKDSARGVCA